MSTGLIALLDDVAGLAKIAASTLDHAAAQATKAGAKAAGIVIDDAAVTPRYVVGFSADRELPIVGRIAAGSLKNKLIILLPAALGLSLVAPWAITPLLTIGGAYLCYEGSEKVFEALFPHEAHAHETAVGAAGPDPLSFEDEKVRGAIRTDFILSAEIMAIALATIEVGSFWLRALVLALVGIGLTVLVYGGVALIVKADDAGVALARSGAGIVRLAGRALVRGMPLVLNVLSVVGTAAMVWVGGGIIIHGLAVYGLHGLEHAVEAAAASAGQALPVVAGFAQWLAAAAASGVFGLLVGAALIPAVHYVVAPVLRLVKGGARRLST